MYEDTAFEGRTETSRGKFQEVSVALHMPDHGPSSPGGQQVTCPWQSLPRLIRRGFLSLGGTL